MTDEELQKFADMNVRLVYAGKSVEETDRWLHRAAPSKRTVCDSVVRYKQNARNP